jgi:hypothetical protein
MLPWLTLWRSFPILLVLVSVHFFSLFNCIGKALLNYSVMVTVAVLIYWPQVAVRMLVPADIPLILPVGLE